MNLQLFKDKKILHVSDSDLDGVGCRIVAECLIEPISKYIPLNTAKRDMSEFREDWAQQADIVIFSDITPTPDLYKKLTIEMNKIVYIFDHHESGRKELGDLPNYFYDDKRCGSRILYDELTENSRHNRVLLQFVTLVDTYDCWKTNSPLWKDSKDLHNSMMGTVNWALHTVQNDTERHTAFVENQKKKVNENIRFYLTLFEQQKAKAALLKEEKSYTQAKKNLQIRVDNSGNNYGYTEMASKISLVVFRLLDELGDKVSYVVALATWKKDIKNFSLRSRGEFDVSKIAERWGGGGHINASGITLEEPIFTQFREGKIHLI